MIGPNTARVSVSLPVPTKEWAEKQAARQGLSLSAWMRVRTISEHRRVVEQQAAR